MENIKILLAYGSPARRDRLRMLVKRQADMAVVGEASDPVGILLAAGETQADIVILLEQNPEEEPGVCSHLLSESPKVLIFALSPSLDRAVLYRQSVVKEHIHPVSDEVIIRTIRQWV